MQPAPQCPREKIRQDGKEESNGNREEKNNQTHQEQAYTAKGQGPLITLGNNAQIEGGG